MAVLLIAGACLFASGLNSPVHARVSWLGLLPLLVAVRRGRPATAGLGGALWGLLVWIFAAVLGEGAPASAFACLRFTGIGGGFAYLGAAITHRCGFHPFLLSSAWMFVEVVLSPSAGSHNEWAASYFLGRVLGTACLGGVLIFCNAALLWVFMTLTKGARPMPRQLQCTRPNRGCLAAGHFIRQNSLVSWGFPRAPPVILVSSLRIGSIRIL